MATHFTHFVVQRKTGFSRQPLRSVKCVVFNPSGCRDRSRKHSLDPTCRVHRFSDPELPLRSILCNFGSSDSSDGDIEIDEVEKTLS